MIKVYTYSGCDSCKKATRWLKENELAHIQIPIRETPPSVDELKAMLTFQNHQIKKLFNVSGQDYRRLGLKDTLPSLSEEEALALLSSNGNLIKRPFLLTDAAGFVGFKEADWRSILI
ncbi:MAG: arsenate reductase family protein [Verrucomicrobiota bacterium]